MKPTLALHRAYFLVVLGFTLWVGRFGFFRPLEILRALPLTEGFDVVISVRRESAAATFVELEAELTLLLRRARLLVSQA